jgi:arabinofuranosyltransferase
MWVLIFIVVILKWFRRKTTAAKPDSRHLWQCFGDIVNEASANWFILFARLVVIGAVFLHAGYYTLVIGGDHFEYRVYSHLIPLLFLAFICFLNAADFRPRTSVAIFILTIALSLPLPWTHWHLTRDMSSRHETYYLKVPISYHFPSIFRLYTRAFDNMQDWLISRSICMRHQEHKIFYEFQRDFFPPRSDGEQLDSDKYPLVAYALVGVPGWVLPHVCIIDMHGLNDYIIARNRVPLDKERQMAHDRWPPEGYIESFQPNLQIRGRRQLMFIPRKTELTAEMIMVLEDYWEKKIVYGVDILKNRPDTLELHPF